MEKIWKCIQHDRITELYCKSCENYICPECIVKHGLGGHKPDLIHVYDYAPEIALPTIDHLLKDVSGMSAEVNLNATEFIAKLGTIIPGIKATADTYSDNVQMLNTLINQIEMYVNAKQKEHYAEQIKKGLTIDKKLLEEAIKKKDIQMVITLTKKIEAEEELAKDKDRDKMLIKKVQESMGMVNDLNDYNELKNVLQLLSFKCQHLRLNQCVSDWKCDRRYFTTKMTLSEDGLTYGNNAGNGYPSIIGDTPFDSGILAYLATPSGLCCNGKEGFGIVELKKYKAKHAADNVTPAIYDEMIGILYSNVAKNMTVVNGSTLKNNETYTVVANLASLTMTIKGPDCNLKANLLPDTVYVPCFSCGCRNNKIVIKPIESYDE